MIKPVNQSKVTTVKTIRRQNIIAAVLVSAGADCAAGTVRIAKEAS